jgi:hypothetical protein
MPIGCGRTRARNSYRGTLPNFPVAVAFRGGGDPNTVRSGGQRVGQGGWGSVALTRRVIKPTAALTRGSPQRS